MAKKAVPIKSKQRYFKEVRKKKHEAGWISLLKIGVMAFFIFVILALAFGYAKIMTMSGILASGLQLAVLVILLIVFIIGIITVSENTALECCRKRK
jgi:uncharacterized membrane protein (DUF485 family)